MSQTMEQESKLEQEFSEFIRQYAMPYAELLSLQTMEDFVYFSDIDTYELLYISAPYTERVSPPVLNYKGKKCYEVLQQRTSPCPFCTNHLLTQDQYYIWKHHNDVVDKYFVLKDKLICKEDKRIRMEVVMDITDPERNNQVLTESLESQGMISFCNNVLMGNGSLSHKMNRILSSLCKYFDADNGFHFFYTAPELFKVNVGKNNFIVPDFLAYPNEEFKKEWEQLLQNETQLFLPDVSKVECSEDLKKALRINKAHSVSFIPICLDEKLEGFMGLVNLKKNISQLSVLQLIYTNMARIVQTEKLKDENFRLQFLDPLTGYLNFDGFKKKAAELMNQYPERKYALCSCDIKKLKYINDTFGYETGDGLLKYWADLMRKNLREGETFCRVSSDNLFGLHWYEDAAEIEQQFRRMTKALGEYEGLKEKQIQVELSTGVYLLEEDQGLTINQMFDRAKIAQKSVKSRSGIAFYTEALREQQKREFLITNYLAKAINSGEIFVCFQPQYYYGDEKRIIGAEALARWNDVEEGFIPPSEFIPVLEKNGRIFELDCFIWEEACRFVSEWKKENAEADDLSVSVNISRQDIFNPDLCSTLEALTAKYGISPKNFKLEITESAYTEESKQLIQVVDELQNKGFFVEMDDFGSGYSSLNILKDVEVDILKLDMHFLADNINIERSKTILEAIIQMAQNLNLPVIAEGVETREQAEYLRSIKCYMMQGYYFAKTQSAAEFKKLLKKERI